MVSPLNLKTKNQWLTWLETLHPTAIELGLERVGAVWSRLRPRHLPFKVISVAGTNGKGSSVALLEAIYSAAGYRVGAYTSPHILNFNERIRLLGEEVGDEALCQAFESVEAARGETSLTYFEFTTLAALHLFCQHELDLAILEVGLGGRLDAVNIVDADVALITSIALDHEAWLGSDLNGIAREKAGIMRSHRPVVFNGDRPLPGLVTSAQAVGAQLLIRGRDYFIELGDQQWSWRMGSQHRHALPIPALRGRHQLHNAAAVLAVIDALSAVLPVGQEAVRAGLLQASVTGRFQVVLGEVPLIFDVAHNPQAAEALSVTLDDMYCSGRTWAVFGLLEDKDVVGVIAPMVSQVDCWLVSQPSTGRAMPQEQVVQALHQAGVSEIVSEPDLTLAYRHAVDRAVAGDRILVFGSFYTVAEIYSLL